MRLKDNDKSELVIINNEALFFTHFKKVYPTLKTLQMYPFILTKQTVDKGAIKFIMNGAEIMCQGFTSAGGNLNEAEEGQVVGIFAEGMVHPVAIGRMKKNTSDIRSINKGIGVSNVHFLGDALWNLVDFKKK